VGLSSEGMPLGLGLGLMLVRSSHLLPGLGPRTGAGNSSRDQSRGLAYQYQETLWLA